MGTEADGEDPWRLEMSGWPGTVSQDRMKRAAEALGNLENGSPEDVSGLTLELCRDAAGLIRARRASERTVRICGQEEKRLEEVVRSWTGLAKDACLADTPDTIGGIIAFEKKEERTGQRMECRTVFRLLRDPEWMGANPILPLVKGLNVVIIESQYLPGCPGVALVQPPRMYGSWRPEQPLPPGEAFRLRRILKWHGAGEFRWIPCPPGAAAAG